MLIDVEVKEGMGRAVERHEARDIAFAAETLGEFFNTGDRDNRIFVAVEKEHRRELAADVFTRAGAASIALVGKVLHANTTFCGVDDGAPKDERIGGTREEAIIFDLLMHGGAKGDMGTRARTASDDFFWVDAEVAVVFTHPEDGGLSIANRFERSGRVGG